MAFFTDGVRDEIGIMLIILLGLSGFVALITFAVMVGQPPAPHKLFSECSRVAIAAAPLDMGARERYIRLCMGKPEKTGVDSTPVER